eukprot:g15024.t1
MARRSVTIVASDGKREGISWYDGATEAAVLRCALVALDFPPSGNGTAHLLWKSGDRVDFDKPITDGVTLHLHVAHPAPASHHDGGGGGPGGPGGFPSRFSGGGGPGGPGGFPSRFSGDGAGYGGGGGSAVAQRRVGGTSTAAGGGRGVVVAPQGGVNHGPDRRRRRRTEPSESTFAKQRALLTLRRFFGVSSGSGSGSGSGFLSSFLEKTMSASDSELEQERRPLLGLTRASSSTSLLSPSSSSTSTSTSGSGSVRGRGGGGGERGHDEVDGDGDNPEHQRNAILKLKRINALLANERTMLAWVRCVGKMFSAGVQSLSLASATGDRTFALVFAAMGMVYVAMGPYVVFVGASRFHQAAAVMQGSVHDTFAYFSGGHLRSLSFLMMALAAITVGLMAIDLLASFEFPV